jgi:hypothetical protein
MAKIQSKSNTDTQKTAAELHECLMRILNDADCNLGTEINKALALGIKHLHSKKKGADAVLSADDWAALASSAEIKGMQAAQLTAAQKRRIKTINALAENLVDNASLQTKELVEKYNLNDADQLVPDFIKNHMLTLSFMLGGMVREFCPDLLTSTTNTDTSTWEKTQAAASAEQLTLMAKSQALKLQPKSNAQSIASKQQHIADATGDITRLQAKRFVFRRSVKLEQLNIKLRLANSYSEKSNFKYLPAKIKLPPIYMPRLRAQAKRLNQLRARFLQLLINTQRQRDSVKMFAGQSTAFLQQYNSALENYSKMLSPANNRAKNIILQTKMQRLSSDLSDHKDLAQAYASPALFSKAIIEFYTKHYNITDRDETADAQQHLRRLRGITTDQPQSSWLTAKHDLQQETADKILAKVATVQSKCPALITFLVNSTRRPGKTDPILVDALLTLEQFMGKDLTLGSDPQSEFNQIFLVTTGQIEQMRAQENYDQKVIDKVFASLKRLSEDRRYAKAAEPMYRAFEHLIYNWTALRNTHGSIDLAEHARPNPERDSIIYENMLEAARSRFAETRILQSSSAQRIIALDNSIMNSVRLLPETPVHGNELEHYVKTHKKIDCDVKQMLEMLLDYKASILSHAKLSKKAIAEANQIETLIQSYRTICGASHENNFRAAVYIEKNPAEYPIQAAANDGAESDSNHAASVTQSEQAHQTQRSTSARKPYSRKLALLASAAATVSVSAARSAPTLFHATRAHPMAGLSIVAGAAAVAAILFFARRAKKLRNRSTTSHNDATPGNRPR